MYINKIVFCSSLAAMDWTMKDLSKKSGVSRQTLSAARHGKRCKTETIEKIASALNMDACDLMEVRK